MVCLNPLCLIATEYLPAVFGKSFFLAKFWYNTSWHSALGFSPFCVLYGQQPQHWHELIQRLPNRRRSLTGFRRRRLSLTVETPPSQVTSCSRTASTQLTTPSGCLQLRRPPHAASADGAPLPQEGARGLLASVLALRLSVVVTLSGREEDQFV